MPDSLITEFKTVNSKRSVFDGKGISPDIEVKRNLLSNISTSLLLKSLFFGYATKFRLNNDSISNAKDFSLTDDQYEEFVHYLADKDYEYTTESEDLLVELEKAAKDDKYFDDVKAEYEALKNKLNHNKKGDLYKFKDEIKFILENEIVTRYHYQKGQIEASLQHDPVLEEAIKTLKDKALYDSILAGTNK